MTEKKFCIENLGSCIWYKFHKRLCSTPRNLRSNQTQCFKLALLGPVVAWGICTLFFFFLRKIKYKHRKRSALHFLSI